MFYGAVLKKDEIKVSDFDFSDLLSQRTSAETPVIWVFEDPYAFKANIKVVASFAKTSFGATRVPSNLSM
jgi:hypothetical protein